MTQAASQNFPDTKSWFDLSNYARVTCLDRAGWARQIGMRALIEKAFRNNADFYLDEWMPQLLIHPLTDWEVNQTIGAGRPSHLPYATDTVYPLTFAKTFQIAISIEELEGQPQDAFDDAVSTDALRGLGHYAHLVVDLAADDQLIIENFSQWLLAFRDHKTHPRSTKAPRKQHVRAPSDNELSRAAANNLLPYFDLLAWERWADKRLSDEDRLDLLFDPGEVDPRDSRHKTLKKNLLELFTLGTHAALQRSS